MSVELIGILAVGIALSGTTIRAAHWIGGWLRHVDRRLAKLEGLIKGSGLFRGAELSNVSGG